MSPRPRCVDEELVPHGSRLRQVSPLVDAYGRSVEVEVLVGDGAEFGRVGDVTAALTRSPFVTGLTIEVGFDPVGGGAPDRPGGKTGGDPAEQVEAPWLGSVEGGEDAFGSGLFEAGVDEGEIAHEFGAFGCGGVERPATLSEPGCHATPVRDVSRHNSCRADRI